VCDYDAQPAGNTKTERVAKSQRGPVGQELRNAKLRYDPQGLHMTDSSYHELVERIHAAGHGCVVALTGGGSQAIAELLTVPGASATVLEAIVPYSAASLAEWLGGKLDQACSERTARAMAMAAFERARQLSTADHRTLCGIGATASLASTRPKRGPHRAYVAWQTAEATVSYACEFFKGKRTRIEEEAVAAEMVLHAVAEACGVNDSLPREASADEPVTRREKRAPQAWTELLLGARASVEFRIDGTPRLILSGAFNPLHSGHRSMAEIAATRSGVPVTLELSIANVDKPTLDFLEIEDRLAGVPDYPVLLTRAATFAEKAALVPGAVFVVGADTIARIADEKYYDGDHKRRDSAIASIAASGCRFLVFGRAVNGQFRLPSDLRLPSQLRGLCEEVNESEFRQDICSTELRAEN
jgi:nicotinamide mononucleotide (NMN) deamidase PncC